MRKPYSFVFIFLVLSLLKLCLAQSYPPENIGKVLSIKGEAIAISKGMPRKSLSAGSLIPSKTFLITRKNSQLLIELINGEKLTLKEHSKITIYNRLIILNTGNFIFNDVSKYDYFKFKFKNSRKLFKGNHFEVNHKQIRNLSSNKIIFYNLSNKKIQSKKVALKPDIPQILPTIASTDEEDFSEEDSDVFGEEEADVFGDEKVTSSKIQDIFSEEKKPSHKVVSKVKKLINIDWSVLFNYSYYLSKPEDISNIDDSSSHLDLRVNFKDKVALSEKSSFNYSGWLEINTRDEVKDESSYSFTGRETKKPIFLLNEYYWLKSFSKFDITAGKKVIRLGKGILTSPADRLSPNDSIIPTISQRLGVFNTTFDLYLGNSTLSFIWVPILNTTKSPHPYSRWSTRRDGVFYDIKSKYPSGKGWEATQSLIKFETVFMGVDFFTALFNGANPNPVIKNEITVNGNTPSYQIQQEFVPVTNLSAGFSSTFKALEVHGEALKQNAQEGRDDSYSQYLMGFRYSFDEAPKVIGLQQIDIVMEYIKETIDQPITYPFTLFSSIQSRIFKNNILGSLNLKYSDDLQYNIGFNIDMEESGLAYLLGLSYRLNDLGRLTFRFESYSGNDDSLFKKWDTNDNLSLGYSHDF